MKPIFVISIIVSLIFSLIASSMAFLIIYEEYSHHYTDKRKPFQHAIESAIFTFIVFLILTNLAVWFIMRNRNP